MKSILWESFVRKLTWTSDVAESHLLIHEWNHKSFESESTQGHFKFFRASTDFLASSQNLVTKSVDLFQVTSL